MIINKANDYLLQNSTITIWYLPKTVEGDVVFNTNSVSVFIVASGILEIPYVVRNAPDRTGELQSDHGVFHLWRSPWINAGGVSLPALGDKLYDGVEFWLVQEVQYMDRDDSQLAQRYRLTVLRSKLTVIP